MRGPGDAARRRPVPQPRSVGVISFFQGLSTGRVRFWEATGDSLAANYFSGLAKSQAGPPTIPTGPQGTVQWSRLEPSGSRRSRRGGSLGATAFTVGFPHLSPPQPAPRVRFQLATRRRLAANCFSHLRAGPSVLTVVGDPEGRERRVPAEVLDPWRASQRRSVGVTSFSGSLGPALRPSTPGPVGAQVPLLALPHSRPPRGSRCGRFARPRGAVKSACKDGLLGSHQRGGGRVRPAGRIAVLAATTCRVAGVSAIAVKPGRTVSARPTGYNRSPGSERIFGACGRLHQALTLVSAPRETCKGADRSRKA